MGKFEVGTRVTITNGDMKNSSGVIEESSEISNWKYKIRLDGKETARALLERDFESESILDCAIDEEPDECGLLDESYKFINSYVKSFLESGNRRDKKDDCVTEIGLVIEHLLKLKYCTNDRNHNTWIDQINAHVGAVGAYMRILSKKEVMKFVKYLDSNIQKSYQIGVKNYEAASRKYPDLKEGLQYIPEESPWKAEKIINPLNPIESLLEELPDMK